MIPVLLGLVPLAVAAYTDLTKRIITRHSLVPLLLVAAARVLTGGQGPLAAIAGLAITGLPMLLCAMLLSGGSGIGGGDVKLCGLIGLLLGPLGGSFAILLALVVLLAVGTLRRAASMPFAPCLLVGYCITTILIWR